MGTIPGLKITVPRLGKATGDAIEPRATNAPPHVGLVAKNRILRVFASVKTCPTSLVPPYLSIISWGSVPLLRSLPGGRRGHIFRVTAPLLHFHCPLVSPSCCCWRPKWTYTVDTGTPHGLGRLCAQPQSIADRDIHWMGLEPRKSRPVSVAGGWA